MSPASPRSGLLQAVAGPGRIGVAAEDGRHRCFRPDTIPAERPFPCELTHHGSQTPRQTSGDISIRRNGSARSNPTHYFSMKTLSFWCHGREVCRSLWVSNMDARVPPPAICDPSYCMCGHGIGTSAYLPPHLRLLAIAQLWASTSLSQFRTAPSAMSPPCYTSFSSPRPFPGFPSPVRSALCLPLITTSAIISLLLGTMFALWGKLDNSYREE
jgi:hypothetical protein